MSASRFLLYVLLLWVALMLCGKGHGGWKYDSVHTNCYFCVCLNSSTNCCYTNIAGVTSVQPCYLTFECWSQDVYAVGPYCWVNPPAPDLSNMVLVSSAPFTRGCWEVRYDSGAWNAWGSTAGCDSTTGLGWLGFWYMFLGYSSDSWGGQFGQNVGRPGQSDYRFCSISNAAAEGATGEYFRVTVDSSTNYFIGTNFICTDCRLYAAMIDSACNDNTFDGPYISVTRIACSDCP